MIQRVAYLSYHTCPLRQPGAGDAGGMNVYIHELAATMAQRGIEVDVFTRRTNSSDEDVIEVAGRYRVFHLTAGPPEPLPIGELWPYVNEFSEGIIATGYENGGYDLVHSHYWLSGWAGILVKEALAVPLANSFHTLGRIKDLTRRADEAPSSGARLATEQEVISRSDCVVASTPLEADELMEHYGASPERLCVSPPGINHQIFRPGNRSEARSSIGMADTPIVLFVGRIQPLKGLDVALEAVGALEGVHLVVVGGPSGPEGQSELDRIEKMAVELGMVDRTHFVPAQPHDQLAEFYRAADVLVMPSRSESFGLVAAEGQACGVPVVATRVGGLEYVVDDGVSGYLLDSWDPEIWAATISRILDNPALAEQLSAGAVANADKFSWSATANRLLELYAGIVGEDDR